MDMILNKWSACEITDNCIGDPNILEKNKTKIEINWTINKRQKMFSKTLNSI